MKAITFRSTLFASGKDDDLDIIAKGSWYFAEVPSAITDEIREAYKEVQGAFGTLPVLVKIKSKEWQTSLFYDTKCKAYLLPVKSVIRKSLKLEHGDDILLELSLDL